MEPTADVETNIWSNSEGVSSVREFSVKVCLVSSVKYVRSPHWLQLLVAPS